MSDKQEEKSKETKENTKVVVKKELTPAELDDLKKYFSTPFIWEKKRLREYDELNKLKKRTKEQNSRRERLFTELLVLRGLDNGAILQSIVSDEKFSYALIRIRQDLAEEYQCKTASELMLADRIVTAYWKSMRYEMYLNRFVEPEPDKFLLNEYKTKILKELHKGIELSNRQFISALVALKQMKNPTLEFNIKAKTAFVAQNQQINADKPNIQENENIEAK